MNEETDYLKVDKLKYTKYHSHRTYMIIEKSIETKRTEEILLKELL